MNQSLHVFTKDSFCQKKFLIDKRKAHYSSLICAGQMTRKEALTLLEGNPYIENDLYFDKPFVLKKLGFAEYEFDQYIASPPVPHLNYRSYVSEHYAYHKKFFERIKPLTSFVKKVKKTLNN